MSRRRKNMDDRQLNLKDVKTELFQRAVREMEGFLEAEREHGSERVEIQFSEVQRNRYVAIYRVIDDLNLTDEYAEYRALYEQ